MAKNALGCTGVRPVDGYSEGYWPDESGGRFRYAALIPITFIQRIRYRRLHRDQRLRVTEDG